MKNYLSSLFLCGSMMLASAAGAQEVDRSKAPEPGPAPKINIKKSQNFELANGLKVIVVENHKLPRVSIQLSLDVDPIKEGESAGYLGMVGTLMRKGSAKYTKDEINEAIDFIGASFSTSSSGFYASSLTKHQDQLLEIVSDVVLNPSFPEEELEKAKKEQLSALTSAKVEPDAIAGNVGRVLRYGKDHPYGELTTEETVENIKIEDIKKHYETFYKPNIGHLIIVGDTDIKSAKKMAKKYFGNWKKGDVPTMEYDMPQAPEKTQVALVNKPGAVQSVITITYPVEYTPGSKDYIPARVMNTLLGGGGFAGRLMQNIREDKGYTYGAYSSLGADENVGSFRASAKVRTGVTDSATVEFLKEMRRMRDETPSEEEVELIKSRMAGSFARSLESPQTIARFALNTARFNLSDDYYQNYLKNLSAVTAADVQAMGKKYVKPDQSHILIVGNVSEVEDKMKAFGPVQRYDIYGNPESAMQNTTMTAAEVVAKHVEAMGGADKVAGVKDIYTVFETNMQGRAIEMILAVKPGQKAIIQKMGSMTLSKQLISKKGMKVVSPQGETEIKGEQFEKMKHLAIMYPELDYEKNGYSLKLLDAVKVDGKTAYQVEVTSPAGDKEVQAFDAETGLLIKNTSAQAGEQVFSDYKEVKGVKVPYKMTMTTPMGPLVFTLKEVKINEGIDESMFK